LRRCFEFAKPTAQSRQIEYADAPIDRPVYELYGLSEEEIALVEGATGRSGCA